VLVYLSSLQASVRQTPVYWWQHALQHYILCIAQCESLPFLVDEWFIIYDVSNPTQPNSVVEGLTHGLSDYRQNLDYDNSLIKTRLSRLCRAVATLLVASRMNCTNFAPWQTDIELMMFCELVDGNRADAGRDPWRERRTEEDACPQGTSSCLTWLADVSWWMMMSTSRW